MKLKIYMQVKEITFKESTRTMLEDLARVKGETVEQTLAGVYKRALFDLTGNEIDFKAKRPTGDSVALYTPLTIFK